MEIIKTIKSYTFVKNILLLSSGGIIAQIIGLLSAPLLSRIYQPMNFGEMGRIVAITSVIVIIASLKYEIALVLESNQKSQNNIFKICIYLLILISFISTILISVYFLFIKEDKSMVKILLFVFPIIICQGLYNIMKFYANSKKKYHSMATAQVFQKSGNSIAQISLGFAGFGVFGLLIGHTLGNLLGALVIFKKIKSKLAGINFISVGSSLKHEVKKYSNFPKFAAPQSFIDTLSSQLPIFFLGFYYGIEIVGFYYFAMKVIQVPGNILKQSLTKVFLKKASDLKNESQKLFRLYYMTTFSLFIIVSIPISILFFFGPNLFSFIFGSKWIMSGRFASWMFLWIGIAIVNPPAMNLFHIFNKQKLYMCYSIILGSLRLIILFIIPKYYDAMVTISIYSIVTVICYIFVISGWLLFLKRRQCD